MAAPSSRSIASRGSQGVDIASQRSMAQGLSWSVRESEDSGDRFRWVLGQRPPKRLEKVIELNSQATLLAAEKDSHSPGTWHAIPKAIAFIAQGLRELQSLLAEGGDKGMLVMKEFRLELKPCPIGAHSRLTADTSQSANFPPTSYDGDPSCKVLNRSPSSAQLLVAPPNACSMYKYMFGIDIVPPSTRRCVSSEMCACCEDLDAENYIDGVDWMSALLAVLLYNAATLHSFLASEVILDGVSPSWTLPIGNLDPTDVCGFAQRTFARAVELSNKSIFFLQQILPPLSRSCGDDGVECDNGPISSVWASPLTFPFLQLAVLNNSAYLHSHLMKSEHVQACLLCMQENIEEYRFSIDQHPLYQVHADNGLSVVDGEGIGFDIDAVDEDDYLSNSSHARPHADPSISVDVERRQTSHLSLLGHTSLHAEALHVFEFNMFLLGDSQALGFAPAA
jgi:hypothetical protein